MITAKEAKELYDKSGIEVENFLTSKVDPEVRKRASAGNRNATIIIDCLQEFQQLENVILPLHKAVVENSNCLGFKLKSDCVENDMFQEV